MTKTTTTTKQEAAWSKTKWNGDFFCLFQRYLPNKVKFSESAGNSHISGTNVPTRKPLSKEKEAVRERTVGIEASDDERGELQQTHSHTNTHSQRRTHTHKLTEPIMFVFLISWLFEEEHEDDELLTGELKKKTQKIVSCKLPPFPLTTKTQTYYNNINKSEQDQNKKKSVDKKN